MTLLVIDDDETQIEKLRAICASLEYPSVEYLSATGVQEGLKAASESVVDLVLTDLHLLDGSGFDVLHGVKSLNPMVSVAVMTAYADTGEAVRLLKEGADDYLIKPTRLEDIERLLIRANEKVALYHETLLPPVEGPTASPAVAGIIYRSAAMAAVMSMAARTARSAATVMLSGESGTGKELVARFIHDRSGRKGPFVAVNISALPESLAESELFGHKRGSFTGADTDRMGRFEEAEGGTLFLDEVGEIAAPLQVKLLRAIQFGEIERVGENASRKLDVRIVTATNRNLASLVAEGSFRRDLYYRLNVIEVKLPPLRERKEDIPILVDYFVDRFTRRDGKQLRGITREALDNLVKRPFAGNVRELENIIERAVVLCRGDLIRLDDLPKDLTDEGSSDAEGQGKDYERAMRDFEWGLIDRALRKNGGNQSAAARELGITERHLRSCLTRLAAK
jgi:Response regulator containing CheY-like receiver, AAA-type ATPase, and DNA-binding domains